MESAEGVACPPGASDANPNLPSNVKPKKASDKTGAPPSRFSLSMTAGWWRRLQRVGMYVHWMAPPRPPNPDRTETVKSTLAKKGGKFTVQIYLPKSYHASKKSGRTYPVVVNFHGGGFTLGDATDDARFARFVLEICDAVFISVDYRLAPEYPFPTPVDDGTDAILWVIRQAKELRINPLKIATSGFSAGGNLAITVLIRLATLPSSISVPEHRIVAMTPWYPLTDYTLSRDERRKVAVRVDQTLSPTLTNLFDASYLYPADLDLAEPSLSPAKASDELLERSMPKHVIFYTCEWDMLLQEGERFASRLEKDPINKKVHYQMIPGVPHAWDKMPSPMQAPERSEEFYRQCCELLKEAFADEA